jgi:RNA polymerase sigma-70 factor, ECF subfamily
LNAQLSEQGLTATDKRLVALACEGSKAAFKQLYLRHYQRVYALSLRLSGQSSLAEEITQDCFVRLWHKLPLYRGDSQFSTWLHSLCVNQALNSINNHKKFWARFLPMDQHPEPLHHDDQEYELDGLILRLPERARIVFVLAAIEGYRHQEIANLLGISVGTSKAQYHRARQLLQEMSP